MVRNMTAREFELVVHMVGLLMFAMLPVLLAKVENPTLNPSSVSLPPDESPILQAGGPF